MFYYGYLSKKPEIRVLMNISTPMLFAALFTISKMWKQCKRPLTNEWIKKMWYVPIMEYYPAFKEEIISYLS